MPPTRMPTFRRTRPLKRWRYVGVFGEQFMICAASVHVGPAHQTFWAVYERASGEMTERTRTIPRRRALELEPGRLWIRDSAVMLDIALEEENGIEATCPNGEAYVWTRKQAGVRAHGMLALGARPPLAIDALAVIDDTAGYHARVTEWWWAAGVGRGADGAPLAFNLVQGVNDPPTGSERAVWIAGVPSEAPPVRFSSDLLTISSDEGSALCFAPEATRSRRENMVLIRSDYHAPFGTFSGTLPGGVALEQASGVVEHHRARW
ncbi:MAG TPA: DUF2804 family protein [Solirubrobacteraceae bacterium]|jgi:hypothetical protein|nr:DUF2804 family protein [Solirubrobacteraceae bacterium]